MGSPEIKLGMLPSQRFWIVIFIVLLIATFEACGQTCIKKARQMKILAWIFLGALFYLIVVLLLWLSYKYEGMGHVNLLWSCLSIIFAISIGYIAFKEPFNRYTVVAILCAFAAIYFAQKADNMG